jgi:5-formyltetrahydrofolate cyclo-ligase
MKTPDSESISSLKQRIRVQARSQLAAIRPEERKRSSIQVVERLLERLEWQKAERILGYLALKDELDLSGALEDAMRAGKTVALPRFVPEENAYCAAVVAGSFGSLPIGAFGIPEPAAGGPVLPLKQLDFVLVPGVAFDPGGRRLGRGKGFYDRLLADVNSANCVKCGIAVDEQIVAGIPAEAHDIAMNYILTPTRWIVAQAGPD